MKKKSLNELTDADIASCQPEAIWLEKKKSPLPSHIVLWTIILMLIGAVLWAALARVDKVVVAEGKLVTTRPNLTLKPLERTVIKRIHVSPGQLVEQGEVLITFDPTINRAEYQRQQEQQDSLLFQQERLIAENEDKSFVVPSGKNANESAGLQVHIYNSRQTFLTEKTRYYDENITRYRNTAESVTASLEKHRERLASMEQIEGLYEKMRGKNVVPLKDILDVQMSRMSNEIEIEKQKANLVEYKQQELAAVAEKNVFLTDWKKTIAEELVKVERDLISLKREMEKTALLASLVEMKAPCRAVVHEIAPFQEGSAVREAESLVTLTPADVPLEAEVEVNPEDMAGLASGGAARVKMDAFPFQQHGTLNGVIRYISADTYESRSGNNEETVAPPAPRPRFRVRLALNGELKKVPASFRQTAGMRLRCEMKVGDRSVLSYLMNPFLKAMNESIREP